MIADRNSENYQPLTWVGRVPVYLSTVLAGIYALALIATSVAMAMSAERFVQFLVFQNTEVIQKFAVWKLVTYAFVNKPDIWFVVELLLLASFGKDLERHFGRRTFFWMYLTLLLLPSLTFTLAGFAGIPVDFAGSGAVNFGVFIAFAALYPTAEIFFGLQARWIAVVLFSINALQCMAYRQWVGLIALGLVTAGAMALVHSMSGGFSMDFLRRLKAPKQRAPRKKHTRRIARTSLRVLELHDNIDPILDKIAKEGIGSLTEAEKERLEKAREALLARERRS